MRAIDGGARRSGGQHWLDPTTVEDDVVLARAMPPVLDVGCGPGRHAAALAERGMVVLGIDITPAALDVARRRGASVLARSVFERVPAAGRWASALLLDGNVGIGGDPATLLARVGSLLCPRGAILVELAPPGIRSARELVRVDIDGIAGPWFAWTTVTPADLPGYADAAALRVDDVWRTGERWFGDLRRD